MTSIEWLEEKFLSQNYYLYKHDFDRAKEMHKQEIMDAYIDRMDCTSKEEMRRILGGQYYQQKFGLNNG